MKDFAAFFFILLAMVKFNIEFTDSEKLQMIKDFNEGKKIEFVKIEHHIGEALTITGDAE